MASIEYLKTGLGRVWIAEGNVGCGNPYILHSCMKMSGYTEPGGDTTYDYCPDDTDPDKFNVVAEFKGQPGNITFTLSGLVLAKRKSILRTLRERECPFDLQIKFVVCSPATDPENYVSQWLIRGATVNGYTATDLTARAPEERASVSEEVTVSTPPGSMEMIFEMEWRQPSFSYGALGVFYGAAICDSKSCGGDDCGDSSTDGCEKIYLLQWRSTGMWLVYTHDGGSTWEESQIETGVPTDSRPDRIQLICNGGNIYAAYMVAGGVRLAKMSQSSLLASSTASWSLRTIQSSTALVGAVSFNATNLVLLHTDHLTVVETSQNTTTIKSAAFVNAWAIGKNNDGGALVGMDAGIVAYSNDLTTWNSAQAYYYDDAGARVLASAIRAVCCADKRNWVVVDAGGHTMCTGNAGRTWNTINAAWAADAAVDTNKLEFGMYSRETGLLAAGGNVYRTTGLWNSSRIQDLPGRNGGLTKVVHCPNDANMAIAIGYDSGGSGGYVAIGREAS